MAAIKGAWQYHMQCTSNIQSLEVSWKYDNIGSNETSVLVQRQKYLALSQKLWMNCDKLHKLKVWCLTWVPWPYPAWINACSNSRLILPIPVLGRTAFGSPNSIYHSNPKNGHQTYRTVQWHHLAHLAVSCGVVWSHKVGTLSTLSTL